MKDLLFCRLKYRFNKKFQSMPTSCVRMKDEEEEEMKLWKRTERLEC
jgi:hypothetical protein